MPLLEFICLANSRKLSARCVAGLRTDTGQWIRPVSSAEHGELAYSQRLLGTGSEPQNFDIVRAGLSAPTPTASQPENWLIDGTRWNLVARPAPANCHTILQGALYTGDSLFGTTSDRIPAASFASKSATESLCLVKPKSIAWISDSYGSKRKARVSFLLGTKHYSLALTDPPFESRVKALQLGEHVSSELGIDDERVLFTISLGEAFEGNLL